MGNGKGIFVRPFWFHRREQWDLGEFRGAGVGVQPIICVHVVGRGITSRLFCLWRWGVTFRPGALLAMKGRKP